MVARASSRITATDETTASNFKPLAAQNKHGRHNTLPHLHSDLWHKILAMAGENAVLSFRLANKECNAVADSDDVLWRALWFHNHHLEFYSPGPDGVANDHLTDRCAMLTNVDVLADAHDTARIETRSRRTNELGHKRTGWFSWREKLLWRRRFSVCSAIRITMCFAVSDAATTEFHEQIGCRKLFEIATRDASSRADGILQLCPS
jgi:hypothetical protein